MTQREKDLFYEVLELLRKEVRTSSDFRNRDWKDADDYIFSALHLTQGDIAEIYSGRRGLVYDKSAIEGLFILSVHLTQNYFAYMRHMP